MSVPSWPSSLPRPMRSGYARTMADGRQSTKNDAGPPRVRRRFSAAPAALQMVIDVSLDQRMRFHRFWEEDTAGGSLPFFMPDWPIDGLPMTTEDGDLLTDDAGAPLLLSASLLVMFGTDQPPSESPVGVRFRITFPLSIMP